MSTPNLHSQIMNLPKDAPPCFMRDDDISYAYQEGHRNARHAAAELGAKADATIDEIVGLLNFIRANFPLRGMINSDRSIVSIPLAIDRATGKETE